MTVTPQTNTTIKAIARFLEDHDDYAICGHVSPDGDCLGSQLALACALRALGKRVAVLKAQAQPIERDFLFMRGVDAIIAADDFDADVAVCIAVDTPNNERLGPGAAVFHRAAQRVVIDHHAADVAMAELSYTDPDSPSTTLIIWDLIDSFGRDRFSAETLSVIAEDVYTGLVTDTGRFAYQNVTVESFRDAADLMASGADPSKIAREVYQNCTVASLRLEALAIDRLEFYEEGRVAISWIDDADMRACNAVRTDAESLIDVLRSIGGVEVACFLRQRGGQVRGSLRAKSELDVARIARSFGGGGHRAAAGFTLAMSLPEARECVRVALSEAVRA